MAQCVKCGEEGTHLLSRFLDVRHSWFSVIFGTPLVILIAFAMGAPCGGGIVGILGVPEDTGYPIMLGVVGLLTLLIPIKIVWDMVQRYREYRRNGPQYLCESCYQEATYVEPASSSDDNSFISTW